MNEQIQQAIAEFVSAEPFRIIVRIIFLVLVAVIIRAAILKAMSAGIRRAAMAQKRFGVTINDERREQRMRALDTMLRSVVSTIIVLILIGMILTVLGFNISALITGTTIVAATIAFGMQNVIKDIVGGITMLIEDQIGVGDYVDLDEASGVVERVGLRTTMLRDDDDNVWYVRNGVFARVGNFSQGGTGRPVQEEVHRVQLISEGGTATKRRRRAESE